MYCRNCVWEHLGYFIPTVPVCFAPVRPCFTCSISALLIMFEAFRLFLHRQWGSWAAQWSPLSLHLPTHHPSTSQTSSGLRLPQRLCGNWCPAELFAEKQNRAAAAALCNNLLIKYEPALHIVWCNNQFSSHSQLWQEFIKLTTRF